MLTPTEALRGSVAAVVYQPGAPVEALLEGFTSALAQRGWRLGGLIQRTTRGPDGRKLGMELVELDTGRVQPIGQSLGRGAGGDACTVDPSAVADATAVLRRAIDQRVDLLVVNKFSHLERSGGGFADEMLEAMAEGIPLLTSVQAALLDDWNRLCGGTGRLLAVDKAGLWRWWGPRRLYADLAQGVAEEPARRVVIGLNCTLVEGPHGVGLAASPNRDTPGCYSKLESGRYAGRSLRELAGLLQSWNPFEAAIGMAAVNAHYNRFDLAGEDANGLDGLACDGRIVVVGSFPGLSERLPGAHVLERSPKDGQYPENAAEWLLPGADLVVATGSTLGNRSLPRLLELAERAHCFALVGPSVTLSPRLFDHGATVLSGLVATDPDGMARAVAEGAGGGGVKRWGRQVTLRV